VGDYAHHQYPSHGYRQLYDANSYQLGERTDSSLTHFIGFTGAA